MDENKKAERIKEIDAEMNVVYDEINKMNDTPLIKNETFEQYTERYRPLNEQLSKLDGERRMIMNPTLRPLSDYGDVIPLKDFVRACKDGMFIDYDGHGYYVEEDQETDIIIHPSDVMSGKYRKDFNKIIWFNK